MVCSIREVIWETLWEANIFSSNGPPLTTLMHSTTMATVPNSCNVPKSLWKNLSLILSFLSRNVWGGTVSSISTERRHDLGIHGHPWHCVIWNQALIFQALKLLIYKWRWQFILPSLDLIITFSERPFLPNRSNKPPNTDSAWLSITLSSLICSCTLSPDIVLSMDWFLYASF